MSCSSWPSLTIPAPPGLHDLARRPRVDRCGEWQVRFGADHILQLWAPRVGVSILLPALGSIAATVTPAGWQLLTATEAIVRELILDDCDVPLPSFWRLRAFERWFLRSFSRGEVLCEIAVFRPGL